MKVEKLKLLKRKAELQIILADTYSELEKLNSELAIINKKSMNSKSYENLKKHNEYRKKFADFVKKEKEKEPKKA